MHRTLTSVSAHLLTRYIGGHGFCLFSSTELVKLVINSVEVMYDFSYLTCAVRMRYKPVMELKMTISSGNVSCRRLAVETWRLCLWTVANNLPCMSC